MKIASHIIFFFYSPEWGKSSYMFGIFNNNNIIDFPFFRSSFLGLCFFFIILFVYGWRSYKPRLLCSSFHKTHSTIFFLIPSFFLLFSISNFFPWYEFHFPLSLSCFFVEYKLINTNSHQNQTQKISILLSHVRFIIYFEVYYFFFGLLWFKNTKNEKPKIVGLKIMSQIKNTNFHLIYNIDSYTNDKHSEALLNPDRWAEGYKMMNGSMDR